MTASAQRPPRGGLPPGPMHPERDRAIFQIIEAGVSFRRAGKAFGITHARAQQIYQRELLRQAARRDLAKEDTCTK